MIPYGHQHIDERDIAAVTAVLRSDWLTQGPTIERFEEAVASRCGAPHAVATSSATAALHLSCRALDLGPGDILWTSPITFVASANCALYCGAQVDFVDIDPVTLSLSPAALEEKLKKAKIAGRLPKIVVAVHFAGEPCDMAAISALGQAYGFRIVEDASHALGARYGQEAVGAGTYADITVFSFHPVKIVTTGEGGMAVTRSSALREKLALLRSHGITRDPARLQSGETGAWYYEQQDLGYNYRMCDLQAALGCSQMDKLDGFLAARHRIASIYDRRLSDLAVTLPYRNPGNLSALHLYPIRLQLAELERDRKSVFEAFRARGIGVNVHYIPVHLQPYFRKMGFAPGDFPNAERYYQEALSLPIFPDLSDGDLDYVVGTAADIIR